MGPVESNLMQIWEVICYGIGPKKIVQWLGLVSYNDPWFLKGFGESVILLMAEIRRSPVEVGSLSPYLQGFTHPRWLFGISEPSTVFRTSIDTMEPGVCWANITVNKTSL